MSLTWLSPLAFSAGLVALAALLFALQRLRVRHRTVIVPTTHFWREATENTRARVFVQRFRHPWAYVLILAIATLAWLAVAGPRMESNSARERVLVLDASARMAVGTRFADALAALEDRARELPRGATRVVVAGGQVRTLLERGEELPLLQRRARALAAEACPSTLERALAYICDAQHSVAGLDIEVFGDSPLDPRAIALAGANVRVHRAASEAQSNSNGGVVALGVSYAQSGAWDRVDVSIAVRGAATSAVHATCAGAELAIAWSADPASGTARGIARDVAADGRRIEVRIDSGGALALDDRASLVLPTRPALRVALSPTVPESIALALKADPGIALVEAGADVVVRGEGEDLGATLPALILSADESQAAAFVVRQPATLEPERTVRAAFDDIGLAEIDAAEMAQRATRLITLSLETAPVRSLSIWRSLLAAPYDFTSTHSFPLFVARAVRWLAGARTLVATDAAGVWTAGAREAWADANGVRFDAIGAEARLPRAGDVVLANAPRTVALLDDDATSLRNDAVALPALEGIAATTRVDPLIWIGIALLTLLLVEWWLVRTERMP